MSAIVPACSDPNIMVRRPYHHHACPYCIQVLHPTCMLSYVAVFLVQDRSAVGKPQVTACVGVWVTILVSCLLKVPLVGPSVASRGTPVIVCANGGWAL